MSKSHIELQSYKSVLQLVKGQKLSGVHKIYYTLAKNLKKILNEYKNSSVVQQYFNKIIHKILLGEAIHSESITSPPLSQLNLFDLQNHSITKAKELIDQANEVYDKSCQDLQVGFKDVLQAYKDFSENGTGFFGTFNRLRKDYSYTGGFDQEKYQSFIKLIDHLALLDTSGIFVEKLLSSLSQKKTFYYKDQANFLDEIYLIFSQLQENYFLNQNSRDKQIIKDLIAQYGIAKKHHKYFEKYYYYQVHQQGKPEAFVSNICLTPSKLRYDIDQIRDETKDSHDNFKKNSEQLKNKIHQVAEELGLHFRIKKQNDDKSYQEKVFYEKFYYLEKDLANCEYLITKKEQEKRAIEKSNKKLAEAFSSTTTIGEAFVSAASIIAVYLVCPPLAIGLIVWCSALFINRLLFKGDSQSVLNDLRLKIEYQGKMYRQIFCDADGKPLSVEKKTAIIFFGACAIATGIVSGALSFMSSLSVWPSILGFLSAHGTTLAIFSIAFSAGPASFMAVGITFIFGKVISDFIRESRHKQIAKYVEDFFIKPWKAMGREDRLEKAEHIGKCVGRIFLLTLAVGITAVATVASMGVFYQQTISFLGAIARSNPTQWMDKIAQAATWINAMISIPFQIEGTNNVFQPEIKRHTFAKFTKEKVQIVKSSPVQKDAARARKIGKMAVFGSAIPNGLGMGELNKIPDSSSLQSVHLSKLTGSISSTVLSNVTLAAAAVYSIGPNMKAGFSTFDQDKVDPLENEIRTTQKNQLMEEKLNYDKFYSSRLWSPYKSKELERTLDLKRGLMMGG